MCITDGAEGVEGNQKLAQRQGSDGKPKVLIETRGEGGYVLLPGSPPECHQLNRPYMLIQGDLAEIPTVSGEKRELLLNSARAFNEFIERKKVITGTSHSTGNRPGDVFNRKAVWEEILESHGWEKVGQRGKTTHWKRPGKGNGVSATTNYGESDRFFNSARMVILLSLVQPIPSFQPMPC